MDIVIEKADIDKAADLLINTYKISTYFLHKLIDQSWHNSLNESLSELSRDGFPDMKKIKGEDFCKFVVIKEGFSLFSGSKKRELRRLILEKFDPIVIDQLYAENIKDGTYKNPAHRITALSKLKWINGKKWAQEFVNTAGFPPVFAGIVQAKTLLPTFEKIQPKTPDRKLKDFQNYLKDRMLEILELEHEKTRCIVSLPTGGGKTRVAVEAFIEWMYPRFSRGEFMIWIAQSEELCDQATACISEIWGKREYVEDLTLVRYYKGTDVSLKQLETCEGGVVVASINQIYNRIMKGDIAIDYILKNTGAIIIDEAHRAITSMYKKLFSRANEVRKGLFPVCGLTATPGRSDGFTDKLVDLFEARLLTPTFDNEPDYDQGDPLEFFKKSGYLARANHRIIKTDFETTLSESELRDLIDAKKSGADPDGVNETEKRLLKEMALDGKRNALIIRELLKLPNESRSLIYACTVEHALYLSAMLNLYSKTAAAISSDTNTVERRKLIAAFKEGRIKYIFNYGVLTTGFDAPRTDHIVLCRPIFSDVLYEQIVGRGMRGPAFDGTEECTIIDFSDTVRNMGLPLAYARFQNYWDSEIDE